MKYAARFHHVGAFGSSQYPSRPSGEFKVADRGVDPLDMAAVSRHGPRRSGLWRGDR